MGTELIAIHHAVAGHTPVVVATVIASRGSTPRTAGSKMIVYQGGATTGSIGGGPIEGDVIARAARVFASRIGEIATYDLRGDVRSAGLDLICGGRMEILLEYVDPCRENELLYGTAIRKMEQEEPFLWTALIKDINGGVELARDIQEITDTAGTRNLSASLHDSAVGLVFAEPVLPGKTVYIVGAGHVARELARLTKQIGMKTLIFDDRPSLATPSRFPDADGIHLRQEYEHIFETFRITPHSYIIIVTRGHGYDKEVLGQALQTGAGYIGMMGSRKKRDAIYEALISEGFDPGAFVRVHCPIGLPIRAETPAELAVSIAAELIGYRADQDSSA